MKTQVMIALGVVTIAGIFGYYIWTQKKTSKETYEDLVKSDHVDMNILLQGPKNNNVK